MMTCKQCQACQLVAMLEPEKLTPAVQAAMAEHQARCAACRDSAAQLQLVQETLSPSAIPETLMQETHANIMAAVRRKQAAQPWRKVIRWAGAAAAVALIGVGVWHFRSKPENASPDTIALIPAPANLPASEDLQPTTITEVAEKPNALSEVEESPLALAFEQSADAKGAYKLLTDAYEEAANRPEGGDFRDILELCDKVITRWPDSDESLEARKLISRCYTQMAEHEAARIAFLAYADEAGKRTAEEFLAQNADSEWAEAEAAKKISALILGEANRLFGGSEYLSALSYGDIILTRYPRSDAARNVRYLIAQYSLKTKSPSAAAEVLSAIAGEAPESKTGRNAMALLPTALFNSGHKKEAMEAWVHYSETSPNLKQKACGFFNAGNMMAVLGQDYRSDAVCMFRRLIQECPTSSLVKESRRMLAQLQNEDTAQFGAVKDLLDIEDVLNVPDNDVYRSGTP